MENVFFWIASDCGQRVTIAPNLPIRSPKYVAVWLIAAGLNSSLFFTSNITTMPSCAFRT
jgi:hypothetical protein